MTVEEDVNKTASFRPSKELAEAIKTYMEVHKCNKAEAIKRIFQEWQELTQKTQTEPSTSQPSTAVPKKWQDDYEKTWAKERAKTDALVDREERLSKVKIERKQVLSSFSAYRGPKIASFVLGDRACPRGWNLSKCASEPCDRRSECKAKGILPAPLERGNTWDF